MAKAHEVKREGTTILDSPSSLLVAEESDSESCTEFRFLGSPTVQIYGMDIELAAHIRPQFAMSCRRYDGKSGAPSRQMIEDAIAERIAAVNAKA